MVNNKQILKKPEICMPTWLMIHVTSHGYVTCSSYTQRRTRCSVLCL